MSSHGYVSKCTSGKSVYQKTKGCFDKLRLKTRYLCQEDFDKGTYRIRCPGIYVLKENIVFSPNPDNDFRPKEDQEEYSGKAFGLGFFAAITVESKNVIIDLNCMTIRQSQAHALQQRFFAVIELASAPFIPKQGPHDFGDKIVSADGCIIKNGKIALSSHHGIHGNGARHVLIEDVQIFNFEVAAIAINGGKYVCVNNVEIGANRQDVPVLGNYSALRFIIPFYQQTIARIEAFKLEMPPPFPIITMEADIAYLQTQLDAAIATSDGILADVLANGKITDNNYEEFKNESGLPDGSGTYGILFHPIGVAVNDHIEETYEGELSKYISVYNTSIHGIAARPVEVIGFSKNTDGEGVFTDPSGAVIQIAKITNTANGFYSPNTLSTYQFSLAAIAVKYDITIGKVNINEDLLSWAGFPTPPAIPVGWNTNISVLIDAGYKYKCGGDSMFHVMKGVFAARYDGVHHAYINGLNARYIRNDGLLGNETFCGNYITSHDDQVRGGYHGANVAGISLCYVHDMKISCTCLSNITTENGSASGVKILNLSDKICVDDLSVKTLVSKYKFEDGIWYGQPFDGKSPIPLSDVELTCSYPNLCPNAFGIVIEDDNCQMVKIGKYTARGLVAPGVAARFVHKADFTPDGKTEDHADDDGKDDCPCF